MAATKMFFITWFSSSTHLKVFHIWIWICRFFISGFGYAGFSDLEDSGLEDFQTNLSVFVFQIWGLIYMFSRSRSNFGRLMGSLLGSLLKYNALEDFKEVFQDDLQEVFHTTSRKSSRRLREVFQTTSKKSSRRLPGSLLTESSSISSGV
ncbi:hypothetical protein F2Q68_00045262 [Brassica cretica]|uniref:Uncharacterized protein n=1 Tax=Brassica cretica TaxID=69181 RepID=A0A8S9LQK6_BRACR|nr:hypothetical protein F2Q68_00045262 [Brassica cretica]